MVKIYLKRSFFALLVIASSQLFSQNISMNVAGNKGSAAAILDLSDASNANLGFLLPKVKLTDASLAAPIVLPPAGLMVFDTNTSTSNGLFGPGLYYWSGTSWLFINNTGTTTAANLTGSTGITSFTYNGSAPATIGLANTTIAPGGTYGSTSVVPQITVNAQGQITGESDQTITPASIGMQNLTQGTGITAFTYNGSSTGTVGLANTTVAAGNYGSATSVPTYTVNGQGQLTGAANVPITGISTLNGGPIGAVLSNSSANTPAWSLTPGATGQILLSYNSGVPTWLTTSANGILYSNAGTPAWAVLGSLPAGAGILTVPNGGTGLSTITSNGLIYGNGTGNVNVLAPSATANYILETTTVSGAPSWVNPATALTGTFILNQNSSPQTANYIITGTGTLGGLLTANGGLTVASATNIVGGTNINNTAAVNATNINSTSGNTGAIAIGNNSTTTLTETAAITNINAVTGAATATNIGTGTTTGNVSIGGASNNVLLPKFTTNNEIPYTSGGNGTIAMTGAPTTNNILSYNGTNPVWGTLPAGAITANNGVNISSGNNVQLGGTLVQNTTVTNSGFTLGITGSLETTTFASNGYVGIAIAAPTAPLQINNYNVATTAILGPARPVCFVANAPMIGFNTYWGSSGPTYFSSAAGCLIEFDQNVSGGLQILTAPSGTAGTAAPMTPWMTILNSGNVGIGITAPAAQLEVATTGDVPYVLMNTTSTANKRVRLQYGYNGTIAWELGTDISVNNTDNLYFYDRISGIFGPVILSNGNVGIGTTNPVNKLDIGGGDAIGSYAGANVAPANGMIVSGTVGIGTPSPSFVLDVSGSATTGIRYSKNAPDARITLTDPTQAWSWSTGWATGGDFSLIQEGISGNVIYASHTNHNVGINTSTPNASAELDVTSTTQGFLPPRMTTAQMTAIASPVNGLMVYNSTSNCVMVYSNGWQSMWCMGNHGLAVFTNPGAATWIVPLGVTTISITIDGAQGGYGGGGSGNVNVGGLGGVVAGTYNTTAGTTLNIYVGGAGQNYQAAAGGAGGFNGGGNGAYDNVTYIGGGGGGASDIRVGGVALGNRIAVAGGGGGGGNNYNTSGYERGGPGGSTTAANGAGYDGNVQDQTTVYCGQGATTAAPGAGATNCVGTAAALGVGGNACAGSSGGGGGGGNYGGGCGNYCGAGGGSNLTTGLTTTTTNTAGTAAAGNGSITITW